MFWNVRITGFMKQLGYNVIAASSPGDLERAKYESQKMPSYPKEGSIRTFDNFIIVKFGEYKK